MFSVGLLYSSRDFLDLNVNTRMSPAQFKEFFKSFKYSSSDKILELTFKCGWVNIGIDGFLILTPRGREIANRDYRSALILQLEDMIINYNPTWGALVTKGRQEMKSFLPPDVHQCFRESGLFNSIDDEVVDFWDKLSLAYRGSKQNRLLQIGRAGEKLSFNYEMHRTNQKPTWQAVESNLAGYDILSVVSQLDQRKLKIEVKTVSNSIEYGAVHVTKNEWMTASSTENFIFHVWHLTTEPKLYVVDLDQLSKHIPTNNGGGSWESVEVPMKMFV